MFDEMKEAQLMRGMQDRPLNKMITIREQLKGEIAHLEDRVKNKKEMLKLLDEYPAIEKFMDLSRS